MLEVKEVAIIGWLFNSRAVPVAVGFAVTSSVDLAKLVTMKHVVCINKQFDHANTRRFRQETELLR